MGDFAQVVKDVRNAFDSGKELFEVVTLIENYFNRKIEER